MGNHLQTSKLWFALLVTADVLLGLGWVGVQKKKWLFQQSSGVGAPFLDKFPGFRCVKAQALRYHFQFKLHNNNIGPPVNQEVRRQLYYLIV